jgi:CheY-specific phosphatase CheX
MRVKFFGQFLFEQGEIDELQLRQALDLMERENQTLGELAVSAGFASRAESRRVNGEQRRLDLPFGELAVRMGVLNSVELEELLLVQLEARLNLEEAIVRLGLIPEDRVGALLDAFKQEQHQELDGSGEIELPPALQGNRVAERLLSLLPRMCRRVARLDVKMGRGEPLDSLLEEVLVASLEVAGSHGVVMTLAAERSFGEMLALGISGIDDKSLASELAVDALGEFLNVLAGNVAASLEAQGLENRLEAPKFGVLPTEGTRFPIASNYGQAVFVLLPNS